ncbi:MAG: hypothetical protein ACRCY3_04410 [Sphingorhabdus sp.]
MEINRKIERFLRRYDMAPTTFGRLAVRDPRLVHDMRRGRCLRSVMAARIESFMDAYEHRLLAKQTFTPIVEAA